MYHTQEKRIVELKIPIICKKENAWLGEGYYFWYDILDAKKWGNDFKKETGTFEIFKAEIDCQDVLDTVFNEDHYLFWLTQIEKVAQNIYLKTKKKATLKLLNQYFKDVAQWDEVTGILFQDLPSSYNSTRVEDFFYRKRIQIVVYNIKIMNTFVSSFIGVIK